MGAQPPTVKPQQPKQQAAPWVRTDVGKAPLVSRAARWIRAGNRRVLQRASRRKRLDKPAEARHDGRIHDSPAQPSWHKPVTRKPLFTAVLSKCVEDQRQEPAIGSCNLSVEHLPFVSIRKCRFHLCARCWRLAEIYRIHTHIEFVSSVHASINAFEASMRHCRRPPGVGRFCLPHSHSGALPVATSKGPALYWSPRVGRGNGLFPTPKFHTMRIDAPVITTHLLGDTHGILCLSAVFLQKTSLDELPEIWCILKGDMSFVDPRQALSIRMPSSPRARLRMCTRCYRDSQIGSR